MSLKLESKSPPLTAGEGGVVKISGTRVTLDTVVYAFLDGATAEEIVFRYPSLDLTDVFATIAWYLQHRQEVDDYLVGREAEARFDPKGVRGRLLARHSRRCTETLGEQR